MINYLFEIDLNGQRTSYTNAVFTTGDSRGYRLSFAFFEGKKPFDARPYTLYVKAKRADGSIIADIGTKNEDGSLFYDVKSSMTALEGELSFEVALADESGVYVTTKELVASVRKGYGEKDLEATDKVPALATILATVERAEQAAAESLINAQGAFAEAEKAASEASDAAEKAEDARKEAEKAAESAALAKEQADSARTSAEQAERSAQESYMRIDELDERIDKISTEFFVTYGVSIDLSNSNPETAVTYTDDAVGMIAGSDVWYKMSIFKDILPCLFKDGKVVGYLNRDNFAEFEDGSAADITSGEAGDVMIEIPKIGFKITKSGTTLTVQVTNEPEKEGFSYMAHTRKTEGDREKLYVGAYLGYRSSASGGLRSLSGYTPSIISLTMLRATAQTRGEGYGVLSFYPLTLIQCLYLIKYKNLNSQSALGNGRTRGSGVIATGATSDKGMDYGTITGTEQVKCLGMEDLWGNNFQWIDGFISKYVLGDGVHALVATDDFNDTGEGYSDLGTVTTVFGGSSFMTEPQGTNELGFIMAKGGGSTSTYFSDYSSFGESGTLALAYGGSVLDEQSAGIFFMVNAVPASEPDICSARLMYL